MKSDIPTFCLVTAAMGIAVIITAMCPVLVLMVPEIGENSVDLVGDLVGGISNNRNKLLIRKWLRTIPCQN